MVPRGVEWHLRHAHFPKPTRSSLEKIGRSARQSADGWQFGLQGSIAAMVSSRCAPRSSVEGHRHFDNVPRWLISAETWVWEGRETISVVRLGVSLIEVDRCKLRLARRGTVSRREATKYSRVTSYRLRSRSFKYNCCVRRGCATACWVSTLSRIEFNTMGGPPKTAVKTIG